MATIRVGSITDITLMASRALASCSGSDRPLSARLPPPQDVDGHAATQVRLEPDKIKSRVVGSPRELRHADVGVD